MIKIIKKAIPNLNAYSLRRYFIDRLLRANGILNIIFILKLNKDPGYDEMDYKYRIIGKPSDLENAKINDRLKNELSRFQQNKSKCVCVLSGNNVIAHTWFHHNYDANGDLEGLELNDYVLIGPAFVNKAYRGKQLLHKMTQRIKRHIDTKYYYCVISYDNISSISAFNKAGFGLFKIKYKRNSGNIILD